MRKRLTTRITIKSIVNALSRVGTLRMRRAEVLRRTVFEARSYNVGARVVSVVSVLSVVLAVPGMVVFVCVSRSCAANEQHA